MTNTIFRNLVVSRGVDIPILGLLELFPGHALSRGPQNRDP